MTPKLATTPGSRFGTGSGINPIENAMLTLLKPASLQGRSRAVTSELSMPLRDSRRSAQRHPQMISGGSQGDCPITTLVTTSPSLMRSPSESLAG